MSPIEESVQQADNSSLLLPFTSVAASTAHGPAVMTDAQGVTIRDDQGNEYIDGMAGLWCVNAGWGQEEIVSAIAQQAQKLAYYHSFAATSNEPALALADRLVKLAPGNMSKIFFGNSGSDANDTNVKLVWYYNNLRGRPAKKKIISRHRAYHGVTVAAGSLTGLAGVHRAFDIPLPMIRHTSTPHYYRFGAPGQSEVDYAQQLAAELEQLILDEGPDTVAAFIAEPIMGAGGVLLPPEGYFPAIQAVLKKYDILMIADEVICGFGRCGAWFGSEIYAIEPDIVTIAKGLTSGYIPMSGSLISEEIWKVMLSGSEEMGAFAHGYTYSAHPVAAAAAMANLDILVRDNLIERAASTGAYVQQRLRDTFADHPFVGEVRGIGLIAAIEFVKDKRTKEPFSVKLGLAARLASLAREEGVISRALSDSTALSFAPALVISRDECDELIARFERAVNRFSADLSV